MDAKEIMRLLRLIKEHGHEACYLPRTKQELTERGSVGNAERALGLVPVKELKGKPDKKTAYICTVILPGEMLLLPDNLTAPCAWGCGRTIQFRPWAPSTIQKVCLYCMAERTKEDQ